MQDKEPVTLIRLPEFSTVIMMGTPGAGKSTFARRHFKSTSVLSSDFFRGKVCDDENNQDANNDAFNLIFYLLDKRLKRGKLTVIDATNVKKTSREPVFRIAGRYNCPVIAIVLFLPENECFERNMSRPERNLNFDIIREHHQHLLESFNDLPQEGFKAIYTLTSQADIDSVAIQIES